MTVLGEISCPPAGRSADRLRGGFHVRCQDAGVGDRPCRGRVGAPGPVGAWGDLDALLSQDGTDRLDPMTSGALLVDEPGDQRWRGSVKVGPGRGDSRCGCSVFPGPLPEPGVHLSMHRALHKTRSRCCGDVLHRSSGQGEGMTAPAVAVAGGARSSPDRSARVPRLSAATIRRRNTAGADHGWWTGGVCVAAIAIPCATCSGSGS